MGAATKLEKTVDVVIKVNAKDLWEQVFGQLYDPWWLEFEEVENADQPTMLVGCWHPEEQDNTLVKPVTLTDLAEAFSKVLATPHYHCGRPVEVEPTQWDSCSPDYVLQYAVYGELVYG